MLKQYFDRIKYSERLLVLLKKNWDLKAIRLKNKYPNKIDLTNKGILFKEIPFYLEKGEEHFIFTGYPYLTYIKERFKNLEIEVNDAKELLLKFNECSFIVENKVDLFILHEIFVQGIYNFNINKKTTVFDIGMNIGVASIYFALKPFVDKVIAFEPVDETVTQAERNFGLNSALKNKIKYYNYGLGKNDEIKEFKYDPTNRGSFGYVGNEKFNNVSCTKKIQLNAISRVLPEIYRGINSEFIVFKIDCEGAEYEIIPEILKQRIKPDLFLIEWHLSKGKIIEDSLVKLGYKVINLPTDENVGFIYALK
jgi:FkbM family methyltransferase